MMVPKIIRKAIRCKSVFKGSVNLRVRTTDTPCIVNSG